MEENPIATFELVGERNELNVAREKHHRFVPSGDITTEETVSHSSHVRNMSGGFILICVDTVDWDDAPIDGYDVAQSRLRAKVWPLYKNTKFAKALAPGDRCLIYVGGKGYCSQYIVGSGVVGSVSEAAPNWGEENPAIMTEPAARLIQFAHTEAWQNPVAVRPLVESLQFITNRRRWGLHLIGGARRISQEDYDLIEGVSK